MPRLALPSLLLPILPPPLLLPLVHHRLLRSGLLAEVPVVTLVGLCA